MDRLRASFQNKVFFALLFGSFGVIGGTPPCYDNGITPVLQLAYTAASEFTISPQNLISACYCTYTVTKWNGQTPGSTVSKNVLCSTSTVSFSSAGDSLDVITYGTTFIFRVDVYSDSGYSVSINNPGTAQVVPPVCYGPNYSLTAVSLVKRPFGVIDAMVTNRPLQGQCVYYLTQWASSSASAYEVSTQCGPVSFSPSALVYGSNYAARMVAFALGADITTANPLCGVNPPSITPVQCVATPTIEDTGYGALTFSFATAPTIGTKCEVYLSAWNGVSLESLGVTKSSGTCGSVTFTTMDSGYAFQFGTNSYTFEFAQFSSSSVKTYSTNPVCSGATSQQFTVPTCNAATDLQLVQTDPSGMSITILNAKPYGACRVTLVAYNGDVVNVPRVGKCTDTFLFTSDGQSITFSSGSSASFKYEFFPNGDITSTPVCETSVPNLLTATIASFACGNVLQSTTVNDGGEYIFSIASPTPQTGSCKLKLENCGGGSNSNEIVFPSCASSVSVTYANVKTLVSSFNPGESCDFSWEYYEGTNLVCTSSSTVSESIRLSVTASQSPASSTALNLVIGTVPSPLSTSGTVHCFANLISCDGAVPPTPLSQTFSSCNSGTASFAVDSQTIFTGSNCIVEIGVKNAASDSFLGASSGKLSFSVASVPAWGSSQQPTVTMFGDSCMEISWSPATYSNGAPILCYEVQRMDGSGSFYVIETCDQNQQAGNTSTISCGFSQNVAYTFQVVAINRIGRSGTPLSLSTPTNLEWLQTAPDSVFLTPDSSTTSFGAGSFPLISVQAYHPSTPTATIDDDTTERLFVGTLLNRCKLDSTLTITMPLISTDAGYVTSLPLASNSAPAFTLTFSAIAGALGEYSLLVTSQPPAGEYSLAVYSLETGGLFGQYWTNILFSGTPANTQKDPLVDFSWGSSTPIISTPSTMAYDMVSIRWNGFIEASFSETYTFVLETYDAVRLWIDDVIVINNWSQSPCGGYCSGQAPLYQSSATNRKFSHIRIDYYHSSSITSFAKIVLQWSSFSQALQIVPAEVLFKASVVTGAVRKLTITPGNLSPTDSDVSFPSASLVAGQSYTITITAKDVYGNTLTDFSSAFTATFTLNSSPQSFGSVPTSTPGVYTITFSLDTVGSYTVGVQDQASGNTVPSISSLTVAAGVAHSVSVITVSTATPTAGSPIVIYLTVLDANGNQIQGSSSSDVSDVFLSAQWLSDITGQSRLPFADDDLLRAEKYGTYFTNSEVSWNGAHFVVSLTVDRAGTYIVQAGVEGGASALTLSPNLDVVPDDNVVGINSLVVSEPFPPTELVVGQESSFTVQLRDAYMNPIIAAPAVSPTVVLRVENQGADVVCTQSVLLGTYTCAISPTVSGTSLTLAILVNGFYAGFLYYNDEVVANSMGPWTVSVMPGGASASNCLLTGVRSVYMAGLAAPATLYLKDQYGNPLSDVESWPTITAYLSSGGVVTDTMSAGTFTYHAEDASVIIPILATASGAGLTLTITVDGVSVPMPYGITTVTVIEGLLSSSGSACQQSQNSITAGTDSSITCVTKDSESNTLTWSNVLMVSNYTHNTDPDVTPVVAEGSLQQGQTTTWETTTSAITTAGVYSVVTSLAQPGGFMAQYYADSSFSTLIGIGGIPLSSQQNPSQSPVYYTEIDAYVNFDYPGPLEVENLTVDAAIWSGYILPPLTTTYTFRITAEGGVKITIGTSTTDLSSATSVDTQIDVDLTQFDHTFIQIQYTPGPLFQISLEWVYSGSIPSVSFVIPAINVYTVLTNQVTALTVVPDDVSVQSIASFSPNPIVGESDYIVVYPIDQFGNSISSPVCLTGTGASCFYTVTIPISDGSSIQNSGATQLSDGSIQIPIVFGTDGEITVEIVLKTGAGTTASLLGSPYTINVAAAAP